MIYRRTLEVFSFVGAAAPPHHPRSRRTCCRRSSAGCRHLHGPCCRLVTWWRVWGCPPVTVMLRSWDRCAARGRRQARSRARYGCLACVRGACCAVAVLLLPSAGAQAMKESILEGGEGFERSRDASRARAWPCRGGDPCEKPVLVSLRAASYDGGPTASTAAARRPAEFYDLYTVEA